MLLYVIFTSVFYAIGASGECGTKLPQNPTKSSFRIVNGSIMVSHVLTREHNQRRVKITSTSPSKLLAHPTPAPPNTVFNQKIRPKCQTTTKQLNNKDRAERTGSRTQQRKRK